MIGDIDWFGQIIGAVPDGDVTQNARVAKALIGQGLAVVLIEPGGKRANRSVCPLTSAQAKKADKEAQDAAKERGSSGWERVTHDCGLKHAMTETKTLTHKRVKEHLERGANLAVAPGAGSRRVLIVDVDTAEERASFLNEWSENVMEGCVVTLPMTVSSPGVMSTGTNMSQVWVHKDGGHYWFDVPDDVELPTAVGKLAWCSCHQARQPLNKCPRAWVAYWGSGYVLVPPSVRPEGAYRLTGEVRPAPEWLTGLLSTAVQAREAGKPAGQINARDDDPIDAWAAGTPWAEILTADGWTHHDTDSCGCPTFTRPGGAAHGKSATAHEPGCGQYDTSRGHAPIHVWSDAVGADTMSKLTYLARYRHGGDMKAAMAALDLSPVVHDDDDEDLSEDLSTEGLLPPKAAAPGKGAPSKLTTARELRLTWAETIQAEPVDWLWQGTNDHEGRIAAGMVTLLAGREGTGKSTVGYTLAAQVTRGTLPGIRHGKPSVVVVAAYEDSWSHVIVPRLMAADADMTKVARVDVTQAECAVPVVLPKDVGLMESALIEHQVALVLLDPFMSALSGDMKSSDYQSVYQTILPIAGLAERTGCAFVGVTHFNKTTGADAMTRIMGSAAFAGVVRGALVVHRLPTEDDGQSGDEMMGYGVESEPREQRFALGHEKNNLGALLPTLVYSVDGRHIADHGDREIWAPVIQWHGEHAESVSDLLMAEVQPKKGGRPPTASDRAEKWLCAALRGARWHDSRDVVTAGAAAGISRPTLMRAAKTLAEDDVVRRVRVRKTSWWTMDEDLEPPE